MVQSVIRLRLWTARILPEEAVHQIKDDFLRDELAGINFGETFRAKSRTLRKPAPVINVRDGHVVNATGDTIPFTYTHHRNVDDFVNVVGDDLRKVTHVAGGFGVGDKWHFPRVVDVLEIAPYEFSRQRSREDGFGIVPLVRRDRF